jgi:hypothetical protein
MQRRLDVCNRVPRTIAWYLDFHRQKSAAFDYDIRARDAVPLVQSPLASKLDCTPEWDTSFEGIHLTKQHY